jgi:hypothetical protein
VFKGSSQVSWIRRKAHAPSLAKQTRYGTRYLALHRTVDGSQKSAETLGTRTEAEYPGAVAPLYGL